MAKSEISPKMETRSSHPPEIPKPTIRDTAVQMMRDGVAKPEIASELGLTISVLKK